MLRDDLRARLYRELRRRGLDVFPEQTVAAFRAEVARMGLPALAKAELTNGELLEWLEANEGAPLRARPPCPDCSHPLDVHRAGVGCMACRCTRENEGDDA